MDNDLSDDQIRAWVDELVAKLGIKEQCDGKEYASFLRQGKTKECIEGIASYLGLPIAINFAYVADNPKTGDKNRFESDDLVKTDWRGRGVDGITAQVSVPEGLPLYGSSSLKNYPIRVRVSKNCGQNHDSFVAVMAHELSHIVLASLYHPEKDNEFYTDLTAMVLGFAAITKSGRQVTTISTSGNRQVEHTTTYGYLSDEQFNIAYDRIVTILDSHLRDKHGLLHQLQSMRVELVHCRRALLAFGEFKKYLDQNTHRKITEADGLRIVQFHQAGYTDEYEKTVNATDVTASKLEQSLQNIFHHTKTTSATIKQEAGKVARLQSDLSKTSENLKRDLKVLKRNLPIPYRLKVFFRKKRAAR